jgi:glycosyltransferase involved in cell wall biosynthesis
LPRDNRILVLYLAPFIDHGGADKGAIDWFRWIDRDRYRPALITTHPAENRRLAEVAPYADELWPLADLMPGNEFPRFILDFVYSRRVEVLHLMNSRLGYQLLPDIRTLPRRPVVVAQLHVDEPDRFGLVRYAVTRFERYVDAFSLVSEDLGRTVQAYGVPPSKCRIIPLGVDAVEEFSPDHASPIEGLDDGIVHILFPARLVPQKDPLTMVRVASVLRELVGARFELHVLGDGPLEGEVRRAVSERGLERRVAFHGPTDEMARWYAAGDVVLLTSVFEGIPLALYEAMAMQVPIVAPRLAGHTQLMGREAGLLIDPRDDVQAYARALAALVTDTELRRRLGREGRARVMARFPVERMAQSHDALYRELLAARDLGDRPSRFPGLADAPAARIRCEDPPGESAPLVSIVIRSFNDGGSLARCVTAAREQTHPSIETIVVDDASTDAETLQVLDGLEDADSVVRRSRYEGRGAAWNAGIDRARGRYVLLADADAVLPAEAIERMVARVRDAGEGVGFVYPSKLRFADGVEFEVAEYNLHRLLNEDCCPGPALFDRAVFEAGLRLAEDVAYALWDFALRIAAHGVEGARAPVTAHLERDSRVEHKAVVERAERSFRERLRLRHRPLYEREDEIKGRWAPALSLMSLANCSFPAPDRVKGALERQSCGDFELIDAAAGSQPAEALANAICAARGAYLLATAGDAVDLLRDPGLVEKLLRIFRHQPALGAICFADAGATRRYPFRLLEHGEDLQHGPHTLVWRARLHERHPDAFALDVEEPLRSIALALPGLARSQWRHLPSPGPVSGGRHLAVRRLVPTPRRKREARPQAAAEPVVPGTRRAIRQLGTAAWRAPGTELLFRHRRFDGGGLVITNERRPPPGHELDWELGAVHERRQPGTIALVEREGPDFAVSLDEGDLDGRLLGYLEATDLGLLDPLLAAREPRSGNRTLVSGPGDPLFGQVEVEETLGWLEPHPLHPRSPPHSDVSYGQVGLARGIDRSARRHVYSVGSLPAGEFTAELGALRLTPGPAPGAIPVWLTPDGYLVTYDYTPTMARPRLAVALRWALAPASWFGFSSASSRALGVLRRASELTRHLRRDDYRPSRPNRAPDGYLLGAPTEQATPLYSAIHPVTGDQLLSRHRLEAGDMGYVGTTVVGNIVAAVPLTGRVESRRADIPWASRFGRVARRA